LVCIAPLPKFKLQQKLWSWAELEQKFTGTSPLYKLIRTQLCAATKPLKRAGNWVHQRIFLRSCGPSLKISFYHVIRAFYRQELAYGSQNPRNVFAAPCYMRLNPRIRRAVLIIFGLPQVFNSKPRNHNFSSGKVHKTCCAQLTFFGFTCKQGTGGNVNIIARRDLLHKGIINQIF